MANRPVFVFDGKRNFKQDVEFIWTRGYATCQRQENIREIHRVFNEHYPNLKVLEISTASDNPLGRKLSAFNLRDTLGNTVESVYQGSKVFEYGGPYQDLYTEQSILSKQDHRLTSSGRLLSFKLYDLKIKSEPASLCYNWLYCFSLYSNKELANQLLEYDAFTDIFFNPEKGVSCQAHAASIFVTLHRYNLLDTAMTSIKQFEQIIYGTRGGKPCQ